MVLARGEGIFLTSKHISLRFHYLKEKVLSGEIEFIYLPIEEKLSDVLTKTLAVYKFNKLMEKVVGSPLFYIE